MGMPDVGPTGHPIGMLNGIAYFIGDDAPIKVGERIRKRFSDPGDTHPDGTVGTVIAGIQAPPGAMAELRKTIADEHRALFGGCMYVVDFGDGIPRHVIDYRVELDT